MIVFMGTKKRGVGRPRVYDEERSRPSLRLSVDLAKRAREAAQRSGLPTLNAWLCMVIAEACERSEERAK